MGENFKTHEEHPICHSLISNRDPASNSNP